MTREDAVKHLENMKWLLGVNNTTVDGIPLTKVIDDIAALLKAQEPRVMTLEEVKALKEHKSHAWVEWREEHEQTVVACLPVYCHSGKINGYYYAIDFEVPFDTFPFAWNEYLTRWRCWTSRPTDEQREAVKWE